MLQILITFAGLLVVLGFILWDHHPPKKILPPPAPTQQPLPPLDPKPKGPDVG